MEDKYNSRPKLKIVINGIEYDATAFLSVRDMKCIVDIDFIDQSINYREITFIGM